MPAGWISDAEFRTELVALGCAATPRQLERWRAEGLLPRPLQIATGRGSVVCHPPVAVQQAQAIERALGVKARLEFAGQVLWAAGFDVDDRYWRPKVSEANDLIDRVTTAIRDAHEDEGDGPTLGDQVVVMDIAAGLFGKLARRLSEEELARFTNTMAEIMTGVFENFDPEASDRDEFSTQEAVHRAMDFEPGKPDHVFGLPLNLSGGIEEVFANLSATLLNLDDAKFSDFEILAARDDVRNGLKIAICLYRTFNWTHGPTAFGLRIGSSIAKSGSVESLMIMSLLLCRLRRASNYLLPSAEIKLMADQAESTWLISDYFLGCQLAFPELRDLFDPKRIKRAFSDSHEMQEMREDLKRYQFPEPEFRPWDSWRKLTKSTMSLGLLAMSIGSPNQISRDALVAAANDPETP